MRIEFRPEGDDGGTEEGGERRRMPSFKRLFAEAHSLTRPLAAPAPARSATGEDGGKIDIQDILGRSVGRSLSWLCHVMTTSRNANLVLWNSDIHYITRTDADGNKN